MLLTPSGTFSAKTVEIQKLLMSRGYSLPKYGSDGYYGGETEDAVIKFQNDNALPPTGNVDDSTYALLKGTAVGISQTNSVTTTGPSMFEKIKGMIPTMSTRNISIAGAGVLALLIFLKKRKKGRR